MSSSEVVPSADPLPFPPRRYVSHSLVVAAAGLSAALLLSVAPPAHADDIDVLVRQSVNGDYKRTGVGLRFQPFWADNWGNWNATLRPEIEASHFRYRGSRSGRSSLNQLGALASFRLSYGDAKIRPYLEAGLGGALFDHTSLGNKKLSTAFQFSQYVGLGVEFVNRWYIGYQYSHYSNAGIKRPNNGLDLNQIVLGMRF